MKTIFLRVALMLAIFAGFTTLAQEKDPVKKANDANEKKADNDRIISEDIADFLVKSADARMMDAKEGKLASEKGTTAAIRNYGKLMINDQAVLLEKIKALAAKRNITLPKGISDKKEDGREDLAAKTGKDFDDKFIKMMKIDHKRDVRLFKDAIEFKDEGVSEFAKKYLPLIQSHLDKIEAFK
jgi:putative membrane protein